MWLRNQSELLANLKREGGLLVVGGDGRADSPGHTAMYGSYTITDLENNHNYFRYTASVGKKMFKEIFMNYIVH